MTQFETDLDRPFNINGGNSNKGFYNLVVSIRDMKLYQIGMKPHRFWKIGDVKAYFGVKGNKESVLKQLVALKDKHFPS
jgi:hypothetical protein